jgi:hypothetical protein
MRYIILFSLLGLLTNNLLAQNTTTKPATKPAVTVNNKIPKINASIGNYNSLTTDVNTAKKIIDNKLVLKDENGKIYKIGRCTFLYKRKNVYIDEDTKVKKINYEFLAKELRDDEQLDNFWKTSIKETLAKGEELIFEKILADSGKGYMLPVKGITIVVQ